MRRTFAAVAGAILFLACSDAPTALEPEPELDCSNPWPPTIRLSVPVIRTLHQFTIYEEDLPYDLGSEGVGADDRVTVKYEGPHRPQKLVAYQADDSWILSLRPDGVNWQGLGHTVEQLVASRPGCTETHVAVVLLFRGGRSS